MLVGLVCLAAALALPGWGEDPEVAKLKNAVQTVQAQVKSLQQEVEAQKTSIAQLQKQVAELSQQAPAPAKGASTASGRKPPAADALFAAAMSDFNAGSNDRAAQEFAEYLKDYGSTDLAGNAQFYLGEIEYREGHYQKAIEDYNKVLDEYPGGNKTAASQLKKAFALLELGQRDAGVQELRSLIQRFPKSPEALQAKDRLAKLGAS